MHVRATEASKLCSSLPLGVSGVERKVGFRGSVRVRLSDGAAPLDMIAAARRAARRANTDTLVFSGRTPTGRAVSLWDELRTWDPGD